MSKSMYLFISVAMLIVLLLTMAFGLASAQGLPTFTVEPASKTVTANEVFTANVILDNVTGMASFEATLVFDAAVLSPTNVTLGSFVPNGSNQFSTDFSQPGKVTFGSYNITGGTSTGNGVVAIVTFTALTAGQSTLTFDPIRTDVNDTFGNSLIEFTASQQVYLPVVLK